MKRNLVNHTVFGALFFCQLPACMATETLNVDEGSKHLHAVQEFADRVLKYGRDTYGPKHTPLFVDGLNIHTHEPVTWMSPKAEQPTPPPQLVFQATGTEQWIISNFASRQTLLRTLDGLSAITGD
jgi:hypothetical protein